MVKKIKIFHSDNSREYFNQYLGPFFQEKGIVHQSPCVDTPQQNAIAERKNHHILEVAKALMFTTEVPKYLWGEVIQIAIYSINRMPSRILKFKTPLNVLYECFPQTKLIFHLDSKVFGCVVFVHIHDYSCGKLDPRAIKCLFTGYPSNQKGYKCFDPLTTKSISLWMLPLLKISVFICPASA